MANTTLSTVKPDPDDINAQLAASLASKQSWKALLPSETGSILLDFITAVGNFLQIGIQNSTEEFFSDTAKLDSSILAGARSKGVRLVRNTPGSTSVTLNRTNSSEQFTIPAYSQFTAPSVTLFNRVPIVFPAGTSSVTVTLYEGIVSSVQVVGNGRSGQSYALNVPGFTISDQDVLVFDNAVPIKVVTDGLWHYPVTNNGAQQVVQDNTLPTGELELLWGNELFGYIPQPSDTLTVLYVVTNGINGNDLGFIGQQIVYTNDPSITAIAGNSISGGTNAPPASQYRQYPLLYAGYGRAVSYDDHNALATQYPGVVDALFLGQYRIAPNLKEYMNVSYVYLLKSDGTQMSSTEFADFLTWWTPKAGHIVYVQQLAQPIVVPVTLTAYIEGNGDPNSVQAAIITAIKKLFAARRGFLGRNLYQADVYSTALRADPSIDYISLAAPTTETICQVGPPEAPTVVSSTAAGTLAAGTYSYAVSAYGLNGETFASAETSVILTATGQAIISWNEVPGATGYNVYGRTSGSLMLLNSSPVPAGTLTYTDTGAALTATPVNQLSTVGLSYVQLGALTVNISFTSRTRGQ